MRNMRTGALVIGILFGFVNLISFIGETWEHRDHALQELGMSDAVLLIAGPFTLILATFVGLKHERFAGYWLMTGGVITAALFAVRLTNTPGSLFIALLILVMPMLIEGWCWLKCAGTLPSSPPGARP